MKKLLRVLVIAELACNGSEDTGSLRIFVFSDDDRCVLVELDVGAVFRDDGHDLGQVDCRKFCDLLAEDIFREVEAMT